jgi:hypothetical protein
MHMRQEGFKPSKGVVDPELSTPDRIIMRTAPASPEENEPIKQIIDAAIAKFPNKKPRNKPADSTSLVQELPSTTLNLEEADALWDEEMNRKHSVEKEQAQLRARRDVDL